MNGCSNCKWCACYPGDHWTPDEYECMGFERDTDVDLTDDEWDKILTRVWENGEEWSPHDEPICPLWEEVNYPPYEPEPPEWMLENRKELRDERNERDEW